MVQLPGPSQTYWAWESAFQTRFSLHFYALCISSAFLEELQEVKHEFSTCRHFDWHG